MIHTVGLVLGQVGEVFGLQPEWTGNHCFDALMNYTFGSMAMGFFGRAELQQDEAIGGDYAINKVVARAEGLRAEKTFEPPDIVGTV